VLNEFDYNTGGQPNSGVLLIPTPDANTINTTICDGDSLLVSGNYKFISGVYVDSLYNIYDADSVITINLTVDFASNCITGIDDEVGTIKNQIKVYPNPVGNKLMLNYDGIGVLKMEVLNQFGQTVLKASIANGSNALNLQSLAAGVYYIKLTSVNNDVEVLKIVKY
jgi:hypothetical protein